MNSLSEEEGLDARRRKDKDKTPETDKDPAEGLDFPVKQELSDSEEDIEVLRDHNGMETGTYYEYILRDMDTSELYLGTVSRGQVCRMWDRCDQEGQQEGQTVYSSVHHPGRKLTFVKRIEHKGSHHLEAAYCAEIHSEARKKVAELRKVTLVNKQSRTWAVKCLPYGIQIKLSRIVQRLAADINTDIEDIQFPFKFMVSILLFKTEPLDSPNEKYQTVGNGNESTSPDSIDDFENESDQDIDAVSVFGDGTDDESINDEDEIKIDSVFAGLKRGCYYEYILIDVKSKELYCGTVSDRDVCEMWDTQELDGDIVYTSRYHPRRKMKKLAKITHTGIHHLEALYSAEVVSECRKVCANLRGQSVVNKIFRTWPKSCLPSSLQETISTILNNSANSSTPLHFLEFPFHFKVQIQMFKLEKEESSQDFIDDECSLWKMEKQNRICCYFCNKSYRYAYYDVHLRTHTQEKPFKCEHRNCGKWFSSKTGQTRHFLRHSKNKTFKCTAPNCDKTFRTTKDLTGHVRRHSENKSLQCTFPGCTKTFGCNFDLKRHVLNHSKNKSLQCTFPGCDKTFGSNFDLKQHSIRHSKNKSFKCTHAGCDKAFFTNGELTLHFGYHSDDKPFICNNPGCDKRFKRKLSLTNHKKIHSGTLQCTFPGCTKAFGTNFDLKRHVLSHSCHSKNKNFKCTFPGCTKAFGYNFDLKQHSLRHSKNKNFKCTHAGCDKAFRTTRDLSIHSIRHSDDKPFICDNLGCDKRFKRKIGLTSHKKQHSNPFKCDKEGCVQAFGLKSQLKRHLKSHT